MPRGKVLSSEEIAQIVILKKENYSNRQIASPRVINNYFKDPENYGKNQKGRTGKATTERERRAILREASNSASTARQIKASVGVSASIRTVQRVIKSSHHIQRKKLKRKPVLSLNHRDARLAFAHAHMGWTNDWENVVFTDEKKFNLDGPDGYQYYFHDLRKNEVILSRRPASVGTVMIWGAMTSKGVIDIVFLEGKLNAEKYINVLNKQITAIQQVMKGTNWIFQQDNSPVHTARLVMSWFQTHNIKVLQWPAVSPDLNIIENLWGYLAREVYANGRQFQDRTELKNAILTCWKKIPLNLITNLYKSMPERIFNIILKKGGYTKY